MNVFFRSRRERPTFLCRQESRQRNSSPALANQSRLIGLLSETLWFTLLGSSQRLGVLPRPIRVSLALSQTSLMAAQGDCPLSRHSTDYQEFISTIVVSRKPPCAGVWVFVFFEKKNKSEPGKASPVLLSMEANQNRSGQKTRKLTGYTRNGGRFSLDTFFVRTKKVSRPSRAKKTFNQQAPSDPPPIPLTLWSFLP